MKIERKCLCGSRFCKAPLHFGEKKVVRMTRLRLAVKVRFVLSNKEQLMSTNDKAQTIKIDIRSLGYGVPPVTSKLGVNIRPDYFGKLDYRFLFENAYDAILLADRRGTVLEANARATAFFQYTDTGLSGVPLSVLVAGVTVPLLEEILAAISDSRYMRIQAFAVRKGGSFIAVEIVAMGKWVGSTRTGLLSDSRYSIALASRTKTAVRLSCYG